MSVVSIMKCILLNDNEKTMIVDTQKTVWYI